MSGTLQRTSQRSTSRKMHVAGEERGPHTIPEIVKPTYLSSHRSLKTNLIKPFSLAMHLAIIKKKKKKPGVNVRQLPHLFHFSATQCLLFFSQTSLALYIYIYIYTDIYIKVTGRQLHLQEHAATII